MVASLLLPLIRLFETFPITLILLCAVGPYFRSLFYSEWYIDELFAIVRNEDAKNESSWTSVFSHDFWGNPLWAKGAWTHKSYRPLTVLSYCLEFWNAGDIKPQPLRAFSTWLHAVNSVVLYLVVWKFWAVKARERPDDTVEIVEKSPTSAAAAPLANHLRLKNPWCVTLCCCLFAAHPVHVENVVYLVGRADMMASGIWCLVFFLYLDSNRLSLFPLHAVLCLTAGLCKESGFMVIPFLVTVEVTRPQRNLKTGMLFLLMFLLIFGFRSYLTGGTSAGFSFVDTPVQYSGSLLTRTLSYMFQHAFYMKLLVFPWDLAWDYSYDTIPLLKSHFDDYRCLLIAATYLGLVSLVSFFANSRKHRSHQGLVGLFWVVVPFLPASNLFFVVGVTVGERLLYCSTCGLAFFVPAIVNQLVDAKIAGENAWGVFERQLQCSFRANAVLILVERPRVELGGDVKQTKTILLRPAGGSRNVYIETSRFELALPRFEKIMKGHGIGFAGYNTFALFVDYGFTLVILKRYEEAVNAIEHGLKINADLPHGYEEAVNAIEHGLKINADLPHGWNALGVAYGNMNMLQEAQDAFASGLKWEPEQSFLWSNLAAIWLMAGAVEQAQMGLTKALEMEPENPVFQYNAQILQFLTNGQQDVMEKHKPRLELFYNRMN
eukprot:g1872.t1